MCGPTKLSHTATIHPVAFKYHFTNGAIQNMSTVASDPGHSQLIGFGLTAGFMVNVASQAQQLSFCSVAQSISVDHG
jgi:hypothetical protein